MNNFITIVTYFWVVIIMFCTWLLWNYWNFGVTTKNITLTLNYVDILFLIFIPSFIFPNFWIFKPWTVNCVFLMTDSKKFQIWIMIFWDVFKKIYKTFECILCLVTTNSFIKIWIKLVWLEMIILFWNRYIPMWAKSLCFL